MIRRGSLGSASVCVLFLAMVATGCKKAPSRRGPSMLSESDRKALEGTVHLPLPADTIVLVSDDGGGRDVKYGFYLWLLHSPSNGLDLSPDKVPSPSGNLPDRNTSDVAEWIQSLLKDQTLPSSVSAASLRWEANGFEFRGDLLRTIQGNYLSIQRFVKLATTRSAGP